MDEIYSILRGLSPREKMKVLGYLEGELLHTECWNEKARILRYYPLLTDNMKNVVMLAINQVAEEEKNKKIKKNKIVEFPKKK